MNDLRASLILDGDSSGAEKALDNVNNEGKELHTLMQRIQKASSDSQKTFQNELKKSQKELQDLRNEASKASKATSSISGAGGAVSGKSVENIKEFGGALGDLESGLSALQGGGIGAAASVENFANVLLNMPISLGPAALAAGAALAVVGVALYDVSEQGKQATQSLRDVNALNDEYFRLVVNGTQESIQAQIDSLEFEREVARIKRETYQKELEPYKNVSRSLADFAGALNFAGYQDVAKAAANLDAANAEIADLDVNITALTNLLGDSDVQARSSAEAETELKDQRQQHIDALRDLQAQEEKLVEDLETRRRLQEADQQLRDQRLREDEALKAEYDARKAELEALFAGEDATAKAIAEAQDLQDKLLKIEQDGEQKVLDLRQELIDATTDANQEAMDAVSDYNKELAEAQANYQQESLERQQDYQRRRADLERDFDLTRLQAWAAQDARSLFFATIAKNQSLDDMSRDFTDENSKASDDFQREQEQRKEALDERLADIQTELAEFKAAQTAKLETELQNIADQLDAERTAFNEKQALDEELNRQRIERAEAFAQLEQELGDERSRLAEQREEEDLRIAREAEDRALQEQLDAIDVKKQAELDAITEIVNSLYGMNIGKPGQINAGSSLPAPRPFAQGGIFDRPTRINALIAETEPEAIVPVSRLGEFGATNIAPSVNVNIYGNPDAVTIDKVAQVVESELMDFVTVLVQTERQRGRPKRG